MDRDDSRTMQVKRIICIQLIALVLLTVLICFIGPYTGIVFNIEVLDLHEYYTFPMIRIRDIMSQGIDVNGIFLDMSGFDGQWALTAAMVFGGIIPVILLLIRGLLGIYSYTMKKYKRWFAFLPAAALSLTVIVTVIVRAQFRKALKQIISEIGEEANGIMGAFGGSGNFLGDKIEDCISVPLCWGFYTVCILCVILLVEDLVLLPRFYGEEKETFLAENQDKSSLPFMGRRREKNDSPGWVSSSSPYSDSEIKGTLFSEDFPESEDRPGQNESRRERRKSRRVHNESLQEQRESRPDQNESRREQRESMSAHNESRQERSESRPDRNESLQEQRESHPSQNESLQEQRESRPSQNESLQDQSESRPVQNESRQEQSESLLDQNEEVAADERTGTEYNPAQIHETGREKRHGIIWVKGEHVGQINYFEGRQPFNIGRSETENQVVLSEISVSRRHCNLYYLEEYDGYVIEDTSYNGVYIAGSRLEKGKKYLVKPGATISVGAIDSFRLL